MSVKSQPSKKYTLADFCSAMEAISPTALAQSWDNVELIAGDTQATLRRVLLCIDLTGDVIAEGIRDKADVILAYHPPILKPISSLRVPGTGTDAAVFRCIRSGIAVYSTHTSLDAAEGGTNDVIAHLCGIKTTEPLEYVDEPKEAEVKVVVFVPGDVVETVADAMFDAGAGQIGDYSRCSYRSVGQGTSFGNETTDPAIGRRGKMEFVDEIRLEAIVPSRALSGVVGAIRRSHPYEEPAFDVYPLKPKPVRGIGRCGKLPRPLTLVSLARRLKRATKAANVQIVGSADRTIERAVVVVGAAGSLPFRASLTAQDAIITGEIRHHDALAIRRFGCSAIALGHWASERPALAPLAQRIEDALPGVATRVSEADRDPFGPV